MRETRVWLTRVFAALLAALLISPAGALPSRPRSRERIQPPPEMAQLKFLEGEWDYEVTAEQGVVRPDLMWKPTTGTRKTVSGPGGFSQISDFVEHAPEGDVAGHEITMWDNASRTYKSYIFRNATPRFEIRTGRWVNGKLVFDYEYGIGLPVQSVTVVNADGTVTTFHNDNGSRFRQLMFTERAKRAS